MLMQFLSQPFPSFPILQPLFIYILLSCLSLWVIKPRKEEWERDEFGGGEEEVRQYTTMMKVSLSQAAPDLSYDTQ